MSESTKNVIIIGSGPAGYTAGLYTARANLAPLIFAGPEPGGQLTTTTDVENYPGFSDGIMGPELMEEMRKQAERFGADIRFETVSKVDFSTETPRVWVEGEEFAAQAIIIAAGASAKLLGLEAEKRLMGRGVSTCATCDGYFFRGQEIAVVGGGDTAMEEANFLTKFATKVTLIHRRDQLRASKIMQERVLKNEKIEVLWDSVVADIHDVEKNLVSGITVENVKSGERSQIELAGLFIGIGHQPNTDIFKGQVEMDENGYIVNKQRTMTSANGVFAAGDVVDHTYRQAITAAGMGCQAAIDVERYLESLE